jgi:hypothetical protein
MPVAITRTMARVTDARVWSKGQYRCIIIELRPNMTKTVRLRLKGLRQVHCLDIGQMYQLAVRKTVENQKAERAAERKQRAKERAGR